MPRTGKVYYEGKVVRDFDVENQKFEDTLDELLCDSRCKKFVQSLSEADQRKMIANPRMFFWIKSCVDSLCSASLQNTIANVVSTAKTDPKGVASKPVPKPEPPKDDSDVEESVFSLFD